MGKTQYLEIENYAGGYAAKAKCQSNQLTLSLSKRSLGIGSHSLRASTVFSAPRENNMKDPERSMEFIGFYIFKCYHGDKERLKHYAGIRLI